MKRLWPIRLVIKRIDGSELDVPWSRAFLWLGGALAIFVFGLAAAYVLSQIVSIHAPRIGGSII